ncbi:MAG: hypothetical protein KAS94_09270 [Desulfobulbaceae bacterium]|nr:hypothetical protein [Desulfobulbaceae bacterium]
MAVLNLTTMIGCRLLDHDRIFQLITEVILKLKRTITGDRQDLVTVKLNN